MDKILVASPLFILRNECEKDLFGVLARLQEIGYDGCELLGFFGHEPKAIARYLRGHNWTAMGNHVPYEQFDADFDKVLGDHMEIGCTYITIQLPKARMPGGDGYKEAVEKVEMWAQSLASKGIALLYHNHAGEFEKTDGDNALVSLMRDLPSLKLEPDLGWMGIAGEDPAEYLRRYQDRSPVLHFKDYYRAEGAPNDSFVFRPTGYGAVGFPQLMDLSLGCDPEWIVADHDDAYENDTFDELALSLQYIRTLLGLWGK